LADRIDMHVTLSPVPLVALDANDSAEASGVIRRRVETARENQRQRYASVERVACNAHAVGGWLLARGRIDAGARRLLVTAAESLNLSARAYHRVLRLARTIADLGESDVTTETHVAEALRFRPRISGQRSD